MNGLVPAAPTPAHFAAPQCHNCGAALATAWCGHCGQKRARRLDLRAVALEAWQSHRWFESSLARTLLRLVHAPGQVARDYVLGARQRHVHPLKLLLFVLAVLLAVLARGQYLAARDAELSRAMTQVLAWSNGSFTLGLAALLLAIRSVFGRREGYNLTEHLVLATYAHVVVLCASVVTKLPTLVLRDPAFLATHRAISGPLLDAVAVLVLVTASTQFFRLSPRRDAARLLLAAVVFIALDQLLVRAYAALVVRLVLGPG